MAGLALSGCAQPLGKAWTPQPRVQWDHIATQPIPAPATGYKILVPQPTSGLFPARLSVSRMAFMPEDGPHRGKAASVDAPMVGELCLIRDPRNEFLQWNTALDDQMAISEVFPIAQRDLGGAATTSERVVAAMDALGGGLGLVYAFNELSEHESEMIGTLYETATDRPLAAFRATAVTVKPSHENGHSNDIWDTDSDALVRAEFERLVRACVREMIANDEPSEVETPEGWVPAGPILPVEWPPLTHRPRR